MTQSCIITSKCMQHREAQSPAAASLTQKSHGNKKDLHKTSWVFIRGSQESSEFKLGATWSVYYSRGPALLNYTRHENGAASRDCPGPRQSHTDFPFQQLPGKQVLHWRLCAANGTLQSKQEVKLGEWMTQTILAKEMAGWHFSAFQ